MTTVAFVGLGNMGRPMAGHLLDAGHTLRVHARRAAAMQPLEARGAVACATAAEAARGAEFIFTNVTASGDVEQVLLGAGGVIESAAAGSVVIDHSTIAPAATRAIAQRLAERGIHMLDCPVSGGTKGAQAATLSIMVGGPAAVLARARPLLERLGKTITHVGDHGAGQVAKACNQIVQVVNIQGIAEALLFARANGVDGATVVAALSAGFAGSKMLDLMGPKMAARDFSAGIEARLHHKDYGLIVDAARDANLAMPAVALVAQQLNALMGQGWGTDDTSSLLRVLEAASGRLPRA
ncbi:MAG: NAD(P)-dependent oxidoreductase [Burkholderiaceae bacterium]|jgi:3-hydroxyisobutyrate dehydrogenase-like beta-hydroxyacid dehydrogenase|nr:NAD(P)-dependent oxidoreductase [Burkholderiaceae bacterium]